MTDDILDDDDEEEMVQVSHLVPESLREDAQDNAEYGELSDAVRQAYRIVAYGDDYENTQRLKQRLERAKNEYQRLVEEEDRLEEQKDETEDRIRQLREQLEAAESKEEQYEELLVDLETQVYNGSHVFPRHADVEEAAEISGQSPEEVIEDLKERNPEVPDDAFKPAHKAEFEWTGMPLED
jgi:chromosome segregation ATPase